MMGSNDGYTSGWETMTGQRSTRFRKYPKRCGRGLVKTTSLIPQGTTYSRVKACTHNLWKGKTKTSSQIPFGFRNMFWCFQILSSAMIKILKGLEKRRGKFPLEYHVPWGHVRCSFSCFVVSSVRQMLHIDRNSVSRDLCFFTFFYSLLRRPFKQSNLADHAMTPAYFYELENFSPWRKIRRMPTWPAKLLIMSWRFHRPSYFYTFWGCYSWMFKSNSWKTNQFCKAFTGRKTRLPGGNTCEARKKLKTMRRSCSWDDQRDLIQVIISIKLGKIKETPSNP